MTQRPVEPSAGPPGKAGRILDGIRARASAISKPEPMDYTSQFAVSAYQFEELPVSVLEDIVMRSMRDIQDVVLWNCLARKSLVDITMDGYEDGRVVRFVNRVQLVPSEKARVYVMVQVPPPDTTFCPFCAGHTYNDLRGACSACGAPRSPRMVR